MLFSTDFRRVPGCRTKADQVQLQDVWVGKPQGAPDKMRVMINQLAAQVSMHGFVTYKVGRKASPNSSSSYSYSCSSRRSACPRLHSALCTVSKDPL